MKYLNKFLEKLVPDLPHKGEPIESEGNISLLQPEWFELLPDELTVYSSPKLKNLDNQQDLEDNFGGKNLDNIYTLKKADMTVNSDFVQFYYQHKTFEKPEDVIKDGEPDYLQFDLYTLKNTNGIKLIIDITWGDHMAYEFSLEAPNKINVFHYTGKGSLYDSETHFGFTDESIKKLVEFFNRFNHGIKLSEKDLAFLDQHEDSYQHKNENPQQLYTDDSNLIDFENSVKKNENVLNFKNFIKNKK